MKFKSYQAMYERDIWEIKEFLLRFAAYYRFEVLAEKIYMAKNIGEIHRIINKTALYQQRLFTYIKKYFDTTNEIEKQLVYMRLLIDWQFNLYMFYRKKMMCKLQNMMPHYLTSDIYVLVRHLLPKGKAHRQAFIEMYSDISDEVQNYFLCEIYLIEEDYKMAYTYLKACRYEGVLRDYDFELKTYSSLKYRLYAQKQPLLPIRKEGHVCLKEQLKF